MSLAGGQAAMLHAARPKDTLSGKRPVQDQIDAMNAAEAKRQRRYERNKKLTQKEEK